MPNSNEIFCLDLVHRVPALQGVLSEHLSDYDEVLPYVMMADIARWAEATVSHHDADVMKVLEQLGDQVDGVDPELRNLVLAGFVEALSDGTELISRLPAKLRKQYRLWTGL